MSNGSPVVNQLSPAEKRALLERLLRERVRDEESGFPLSHGQKALWFLYQLAPESAAYNVITAFRFRPPLDSEALTPALRTLISRHPALRTTYSGVGGAPVQQVHGDHGVLLELKEASAWSEVELNARLAEEAHRPFDLVRGPVLRVSLFNRGERENIFLMVAHHIAIDGWCFGVLMEELLKLYFAEKTGTAVLLPPVGLQYRDFVRWQDKLLSSEEGEQLWSFWREELAEECPPLNLPTDGTRPPFQTYQGATLPFRLEGRLTRQLKGLAQNEGATLFVVLLAGLQLLLHRYSGQELLRVCSPTTGRLLAEFERTVGYFVNPVVLQADMSGNPPFAAFLDQVRRRVMAALEHQAYPFPLLVERLQPKRDPSRSPLCDVAFSLQSTRRLGWEEVLKTSGAKLHPSANVVSRTQDSSTSDQAGFSLEPYPVEQRSSAFDLELQLFEIGEELSGFFRYNTDLFNDGTIARMTSHFQRLLEGIVADPNRPIGEVPLLAEAERRQIVVEWNETVSPYPREQCIHELFEAQVERAPDAVAVVFDGQQLTYRELNRRANHLAGHLTDLGVRPEALVGICMRRSLETLIGVLGVLKAGGAYVPLDPSYPAERLRWMIEDSRAQILLTEQEVAGSLPLFQGRMILLDQFLDSLPSAGGKPELELSKINVKANNLAYVIYTSGSTGRPKGVMIEHRGAANLAAAEVRAFGLRSDDRILQFASLSFDASVWEMFATFHAGATLVLCTSEAAMAGGALLRLLKDQSITVATLPPSVLSTLESAEVSTLRTLIVAGEACPVELVDRWAPGRRFINAYGPTETTVCATLGQCREGAGMPSIGRPIQNMQAYILDSQLEPMPIGVAGELHIGGEGLARGYLNRPDLTQEKFILNPFSQAPGSRLYKTGDLARYRADGSIEFLGRVDTQVKVRGLRIELGEIEAVLRRDSTVRQAVVIVREDIPADRRLVAYVVPQNGETLDLGALRRSLKQELPDYMVPSAFVRIEQVPLTSNGKVDAKALPAPDPLIPESQEAFVAPRNEAEHVIATAWQDVLHLEKVGIHDNFFDVGGHSLLIIQVQKKLKDSLGNEVPLTTLFQYPTVASLAQFIRGERSSGSSFETVKNRVQLHQDAIRKRRAVDRKG